MARDPVPDDTQVTLLSSDGREFVIDIKSARKSGYIRTLLGDGKAKPNGKKLSTGAADAGASAAAANTASAMTALGTAPPPAETQAAATEAAAATTQAESANGTESAAAPAGYSNPFATDEDANGSTTNGEDEDGMGLESGFAEAQDNTIKFENVRGDVLEKIVEYLEWNAKYSEAPKDIEIPPFEPKIPPQIALELLIAADYLDA